MQIRPFICEPKASVSITSHHWRLVRQCVIYNDMQGHIDSNIEKPPQELRRGLGLPTATSVVIASMIGVGILTTSGYIIKDTQSHTLMLILWLVGGLLALCGALSIAELATALPHAGGEYVFIREAYGRPWAFLYGWVSFLIGFSAPAAIVAYAAARYLIEPWLANEHCETVFFTRMLAALFIVILTAIHLFGQALSSRVQTITTILKLAVLAAIVLGAFVLRRGSLGHLSCDLPDQGTPWGPLAISLVYVMFSYTGWNAATYLAGEVREPHRVLPRSILLGCSVVIVFYLLLNIVYARTLGVSELSAMSYAQVEPIAALAAQRLFGTKVAALLSAAIGVGMLATLSAFILTGPRIYYAMALDGLFPKSAGILNATTATPNNATVAQAVCSLILLFSGTFKNILTYTGVGLALSSFIVILAVFVLRVRRPDMHRPFKTFGYPVVPLLFLVCTAWMIVFAILDQPYWSTISIVSILVGIPVYYIWQSVSANRN